MCFYSPDVEWYASVNLECACVAAKLMKCMECRSPIAVGESYYALTQQQYETCKQCDCVGGCQCEEPDFGKSYDYHACLQCRAFLECVEAAELDAGCDGVDEGLRPTYEGMLEEISGGGPDEAKKYFKAALRLHPELKASGYLGRLWARMF